MQKQIVIATVLLGTAGAGMFVAAKHALRHPDSFLARCATIVYHLGDPWLGTRGDHKPIDGKGRDWETETRVTLRSHGVVLGPIEPIVVEAADDEAPLTQPRLSPEIAAAIERLRSEEDNETAKAFDGSVQTARMPYADEGPEELPFPALATAEVEINLPGVYGFFVPPWQPLLERLMESLRMSGN